MKKREKQLIKYLAYDDDLVNIVDAVFAEEAEELGIDALNLMQITADKKNLRVISSVQTDGWNPYVKDEVLPLCNLPREALNGSAADENSIFVPVFLRQKTAMYVCACNRGRKLDGRQIQGVCGMALVIQSIVSRKNFEDSLENSYKLLGDILNRIPTGVAVLDGKEKKVLLMNGMAAGSKAVQNAMGIALKRYLQSGDKDIEEVYEPETGLWFDAQFSGIKWLAGEDVVLCTVIDVTQKVKNQQRAEYQANNDYLTGLFNRMKCERDLALIIEKAVSESVKGIVVYLDLDDFKQVNDGLGHQYGDVLLQEISAGISKIPQIADNCYRMGGDEFVIIIRPEVFGEVTQVVDRICRLFAAPWNLMGVEHYCTMSMGLAVFPDNGTHTQDILRKADFAMYEAKNSGKNRYMWYKDVNAADERSREEYEKKVCDAVKDGCAGIRTAFEPLVDSGGRVAGAEICFALAEEGAPDVRSVGGEFAEEGAKRLESAVEYLGLTLHVGGFLFWQACGFSVKNPGIPVYVPVYPAQLLEPDAVKNFLGVLEKTGAFPTDIVLKLSETAKFRDESKAKAVIAVLRAHGFNTAVDKFGEGAMSVAGIIDYGASAVFMSSNLNTDGFSKLASAVGDMARNLGFTLCFTDVDTEEKANECLGYGAGLLGGSFAKKCAGAGDLPKERL